MRMPAPSSEQQEEALQQEGQRQRGQRRPSYRFVGALVSTALLVVLSNPRNDADEGSGADGPRRQLGATLPCDAYLADALREGGECSIPPEPGTPEFLTKFGGQCDPTANTGWKGSTFQCMYVDRTSRLLDDPEFPDGVQVQSAAVATFVDGAGTPYGAVSFRQKAVPGCGEGGLVAPNTDTGLCDDGSKNARTTCIGQHHDHCDRESQFSVWMKNPYLGRCSDATKFDSVSCAAASTSDVPTTWTPDDDVKPKHNISFTKWAVYDHSVPKGGACPGVDLGTPDAVKCASCGVEIAGDDHERLLVSDADKSLYSDMKVPLYDLAFSTIVDLGDHIGSKYCNPGRLGAGQGCDAPSLGPEGPALNFCQIDQTNSLSGQGDEPCWFPYSTKGTSKEGASNLDLPIDPEATYADGGYVDSLVKHTIVVWGSVDGAAPTIQGCAQIRPVAREGSCFLATHVVTSYFRTYYCPSASMWTLVPFVMWLSYMFLVLGTTADNFFCPALASLSDMIGLTPRVAGVTLLALGNGAPDVFSIYASTKAGEYGIAVGEVTGAANFVCTGVIGICCIIHVNNGHDGLKARGMFLRDVFMLIVSTMFLLYMLYDAHVTKTECIIFVMLYVVYVRTHCNPHRS